MEINFWNGQAIVAIFILTHFYYILLLDFSSFDLAYSASEVFPSIWTVHPPPPHTSPLTQDGMLAHY